MAKECKASPRCLTCTDRGEKDVAHASRRARILVCSPDLSIRDFLETDAGFVWVEVAGVRMYSCYFSPSDPLEIFETKILLLEKSHRRQVGGPLLRASRKGVTQ